MTPGRKRSRFAALLLALASIWIQHDVATAATISKGGGVFCDFHLRGKIVPDDLVKFQRIVLPPKEDDPRIWWLCLSSEEGGNFDTALQMINHMLKQGGYYKGVGTRVEPNSRCFSACALIFLAGRRMTGDSDFEVARQIHPTSSLGFHQPNFREDVPASDLSQLATAYESGVTAIARLLSYDASIFPKSLMAEFLERRSGESFDILTVDDLGRWKIELYDYEIPKLDKGEQLYNFCANADGWRSEESSKYPMQYVREDSSMLQTLAPLLQKRVSLKEGVNKFAFEYFGPTYEQVCYVRIANRDSPESETLDRRELRLNAYFGLTPPNGVETSVSTGFWGYLEPDTRIATLHRR